MCINPISVFNKAIYSHPLVTSSFVEVPCNNCAACRDARKTSWEDRLCLEVYDWYKDGGIGLMLTFTYNDFFCLFLVVMVFQCLVFVGLMF